MQSAVESGFVTKSVKKYPVAKVIAFVIIVIAWVALDQMTKSLFYGLEPGGIIAGPFLGLVDIRLVHNTGGAWGFFSDSTFALGVFSLVVCAAIALFFLASARQSTWLQAVAFALIVAGGIGNAIDRFAQGYVTDFLEFSFMDFPVFNVADIGVTCGFALLVIALLVSWRSEAQKGDEA